MSCPGITTDLPIFFLRAQTLTYHRPASRRSQLTGATSKGRVMQPREFLSALLEDAARRQRESGIPFDREEVALYLDPVTRMAYTLHVTPGLLGRRRAVQRRRSDII